MFDLSIVFIFENIFVLMLLFWFLSWIGDKFYKAKYYIPTTEIYECGFLSTHGIRIQLNSSFILIAWLLILYDIEFFFLIPFLFNLNSVSIISLSIFWFFWLMILLSFIFDWFSPSLRWIS